jgi:hypothetical protein
LLSNPGHFAISVVTNEGIRHQKVLHYPLKAYTLGTKEYDSLDALINDSKETLYLKFACPKGVNYLDFKLSLHPNHDGDEFKSVLSLKTHCLLFVYRNKHMYQDIRKQLPVQIVEQYYSAVVDSIISDLAGRDMWKEQFLTHVVIVTSRLIILGLSFVGRILTMSIQIFKSAFKSRW